MTSVENLAQFVAAAGLAGAGAANLTTLGTQPLKSAPRAAARLAPLCLSIALAALTVSLVSRGIQSGRWPMGMLYEFTLLFSISLLAPYTLLRRRNRQPHLGATVSILGLVLLVGARLTLPTASNMQTLPLVLRGMWLVPHTLLLALACGLLGLAASAAALQLATPQLQLSAAVDWSMNLGYVALGLGIIVGAIWAKVAWGHYWTWSIKEVWTLATWWACTIYLHVRHRPGWPGSRAL